MLTSLFGELGPRANPAAPADGTPPGAVPFAATAIMESVATEVNARGQMVDRHSHDLLVTGSPAQAMRDHIAATRGELDTTTSLITLLDPAGVWASAVIKALSDAGGRPIERLHLRDNSTLRTLATIERTTLVRRHEETLRIYHADVRVPGLESGEIPVALMERSHMTTVIIGPLQPHAIDALLEALRHASELPTWRCPNLLFMLPPNAVWIANKVSAVAWPSRLHVQVLSESMTSASAVWNAMLGMWNQVRVQPGWDAGATPAGGAGEQPAAADAARTPSEVERPAPSVTGTGVGTTVGAIPAAAPRSGRGVLDPMAARQALSSMLPLDGLLGCAVVDATTGLTLARESRDEHPVDMERAAAAAAQVLRAHRAAARSTGLADHIDEVMTVAGPRLEIMRAVTRHPDLFLLAWLDKQRTNLALARFQLMEIERNLD